MQRGVYQMRGIPCSYVILSVNADMNETLRETCKNNGVIVLFGECKNCNA